MTIFFYTFAALRDGQTKLLVDQSSTAYNGLEIPYFFSILQFLH